MQLQRGPHCASVVQAAPVEPLLEPPDVAPLELFDVPPLEPPDVPTLVPLRVDPGDDVPSLADKEEENDDEVAPPVEARLEATDDDEPELPLAVVDMIVEPPLLLLPVLSDLSPQPNPARQPAITRDNARMGNSPRLRSAVGGHGPRAKRWVTFVANFTSVNWVIFYPGVNATPARSSSFG